MKRTYAGIAAASLLIGLPLAAAAHDDDQRRWRGDDRHGRHFHPENYHPRNSHPKYKHRAPVAVYQPPPAVYYPPPRVAERPVYVPVPVAPAPPPRPWPFNHVDIGFRVFF
jgi:hypothetical protein